MELAESFSGVGVEVGVERANFSTAILQSGRVAHLYSIDPWEPISGFYSVDSAEEAFMISTARLKGFTPRSTILRQDGRLAAALFPDESLDFVYIDSSHTYLETYEQMTLWYPKIKSAGGILSGHDYVNGDEVRKAVDQFSNERCLQVETTEADTDLPLNIHINSWIIRK